MKASLVSATSLAALLAFDVSPAQAQVFTLNNASLGFGNTLVNCAALSGCTVNTITEVATIGPNGGSTYNTTLHFTNATGLFSGNTKTAGPTLGSGTTVSNAYTFSPTIASGASVSQSISITATQVNKTSKSSSIQTATVVLSGTGVAPVESTGVTKSTQAGNGSVITPGASSGGTVNLGYVLTNNTPTSASATITVSNTGTGNLATYWNGSSFAPQPASVSNLNGSVSLANGGGVSGTSASSVSLQDSNATTANGFPTSGSTTASFTYQFTPTANSTAANSTVAITFSDGSGAGSGLTGQNKSQVVTYTLTGTGVSPIASIAGTNVGYVLAGTSKSAIVTVENTGNGSLAFGGTVTGAGSVANLFGSVNGAAGGSLFIGGGNTVAGLNDSFATSGSTTSTFSYVFTPTTQSGPVSTTVTGTFSYGTGNSVSLGTAAATVTGTGVAPISNVTVTKSGGSGGTVTGAAGPGQATVTGAGAMANLGYVLVRGPTAAATVTVNNTGNGDLVGDQVVSGSTISNLNGVQGAAGSSVFVGTGGSISLQDSTAVTVNGFTTAGSTTATFTYNFAPTISNGSAVSATAVTTFTNSLGSNGQYASSIYTTTLVGTGVAPVASISNTNAGYALVNAPTATTSATVTVYNNGNGNQAFGGSSTGAATISNLQGTVTGLTPPQYGGSGGTLGVGTVAGLADATTQNFTYNFAPTINTASSATVTATFGNGSANGQNLSGSATATITGTGVAPIQNVAVANTGGTNANTINGNIGYVLVQSTATATISVNNTGNGNLSGAGTISNLQGTVGGLTPPSFNGTGGALGAGTVAGLTDTTSQNFTYVYKPTIISTPGGDSGVVTTTFSNGSTDGQNTSGGVNTTLTGTGVAPINSIATSNALARFNAYTPTTTGTGTASVTISNIGNGNLAGADAPTFQSNLHGSVTGFSGSFFSQTSGSNSVNLVDPTTSPSLNSSTLGYTYTPTARGTNTATVSLSFNNGSNNSQNLPQSVSATLSGSGVGPTYASTYYAQSAVGGRTTTSAAITITHQPPALAPSTSNAVKETQALASTTIGFGSLTYGAYKQVLLNISNISMDSNGGNNALTDLTLESFSIIGGAGTDPTAFSVPSNSFAVGSGSGTDTLLQEGDQVYLPILVYANAVGSLTGFLTISTDESAALGEAGDTFTYYLSAASISTVPEPGSLAIISIALGGLAFAQRRRRKHR